MRHSAPPAIICVPHLGKKADARGAELWRNRPNVVQFSQRRTTSIGEPMGVHQPHPEAENIEPNVCTQGEVQYVRTLCLCASCTRVRSPASLPSQPIPDHYRTMIPAPSRLVADKSGSVSKVGQRFDVAATSRTPRPSASCSARSTVTRIT